ncbi:MULTISPECIES: CcdC protein domain-containing protein [Kitasatospora]|uniref:CcdC protein domain-containing protein n=1 Tax=Kitasatospora TaxID=2063 RepID=UPI000C70A69C|nr:CcdC protein domain-containing protein [Kitasatospora sp. GP30]MDH6143109.1 hypothetical protein [Kitasatospora sp. GP30]
MPGFANIIIIIAVMALIVSRQFRAQKLDDGRRFWLLPLILGAIALSDHKLIDSAHRTESVALLAGSIVVMLAMGSVWGWTVRLWRESDGSIWMKGTGATLAAWIGLIAVRLGVYALGSALHVHQASSGLLLTLGVLLLTRGAVLKWRARLVDDPRTLHPVA